jgi:rhodanese-related sulfurtransferase
MSAPVKTISASQFLKEYRDGSDKLYIVDLRTYNEVESEYIDDCAHFPVQTLSSAELHSYLEKDGHSAEHPIYLLCAGGPRASLAAEKLKEDFVAELIVISGGLNALKASGLIPSKGPGNSLSLERQVRIAAGSLVVIGILAGQFMSPLFYGLSGFVSAGLIFAGVTDTCGMVILLARMPWNAGVSRP